VSVAPERSQVEALRSILAQETGLRFEDDKLQVLSELLANRMLETGSPSADAYLARLETSPEEISSLARTLTVSETYFLRNRDQFRAFEALFGNMGQPRSRPLFVLLDVKLPTVDGSRSCDGFARTPGRVPCRSSRSAHPVYPRMSHGPMSRAPTSTCASPSRSPTTRTLFANSGGTGCTPTWRANRRQ
jgi:hypothetical protein